MSNQPKRITNYILDNLEHYPHDIVSITINYINANDDVDFMIKRGLPKL